MLVRMMNEPPGSELSERSGLPDAAEGGAPRMRLLPWTTPDDRSCFLISDAAGGPVSDLADSIEEMQLDIGEELLRHARAMHADPKVPDREFRYLSRRLAEALGDALRVARN
ncbi:hypothetical protein ACGF4C_20830 [Streptomyces sp. NPDC048197]|uniref:hypothetical protein n=2 Tax=unclassified Streptomyces TaxID=2593676 RepID=UPI0037172F95